MSERDAIVCQRCGYPPYRHSGGMPNTCPIVATYLPPSGDHLPASVEPLGQDESDLAAVSYMLGERDGRATHAGEVERLREALKLAANRLARAALDHDVSSAKFLEVSEWGDEARQALEASR